MLALGCKHLFTYMNMSMPELVPENHAEIFDYLRNFEPSERLQNLGFWLMHAGFSSDMRFEDDAEAMISEHVEAGGSLIIAPNHQSNSDMPTVGGLAYEPAFSQLKGTTTAPGKASMLDWPIIGKHLFRQVRVHPTFRRKDFAADEAGTELRYAAVDSLINYNIDFMNAGGHCAIFAEGTRNKGNPRQLQEIKTGIARIALGVKDPSRVLIAPMGFAYKSPKVHMRPLVYVKEPFCAEGMEQAELLESVGDYIQAATNHAFALVDKH